MKRTSKSVFFIVAVVILLLTYTALFGVYKSYGDRQDTVIRGAKDIRFGIDIRGGVDVTFGPKDETLGVTENQLNGVKAIIEERMVLQNITDYEIYADSANKQVVVRFPWDADETDYDPTKAIAELGQTAQLEFHIGSDTDDDGKPTGELVITGDDVESAEDVHVEHRAELAVRRLERGSLSDPEVRRVRDYDIKPPRLFCNFVKHGVHGFRICNAAQNAAKASPPAPFQLGDSRLQRFFRPCTEIDFRPFGQKEIDYLQPRVPRATSDEDNLVFKTLHFLMFPHLSTLFTEKFETSSGLMHGTGSDIATVDAICLPSLNTR